MDKITISGREYRVEANWRAITGYLKARGTDSLEAVADVVNLTPSSIGGIMAACINEGERMEGRDAGVTEQLLDDLRPAEAMRVVHEFVNIYIGQVTPAVPPEAPKKEDAQ